MREVLIGNHMPASKAEMAAYSDELEAVADGFEAAKTEYIEGQCSGSGASAIWGNSDSAVADCVAFSVCQDWDQTDDVNDCAALSNFPESHVVSGKAYSSCAFCNDDKTQPGCECFETGYHVAITSPPAAVWGDDHSGDGSGEDTHDESGGISTNWRSLPLDCGGDDQGDESGGMSYPCRAPVSTDRCTMTNHTNPDGSHDFLDPDDSGSPLHGVCTRSYPSANKDIGEAIGSGEQVVTYRLFASAAMSSGEDGVAPFFASEFAVNYLNSCSNQTDDRDENQQWPGVQCGSADVAPSLDDVVMDGMRNEGTILFNPTNLDSHMALLLNTVQQPSALNVPLPQLGFTGAVLACVNISNGGSLRASDMIKFSVQNLTNHDGASVTASGNVVVNGVTNEAGAEIDVASGRLSIANAVNGGEIHATVSSAFLADVENLATATILLSADEDPSVGSGDGFALETITNHGIVTITAGLSRTLTACGVANSAGATIAVHGSTISAMHILENSGTLDFTGSTGTVTMVGSASVGTVTGDEGITWVLNGQDCAVTPAPTATAQSPPAPHGYTFPPTSHETYIAGQVSARHRWLSEQQGFDPEWTIPRTSDDAMDEHDSLQRWLLGATDEEIAAYYAGLERLEREQMASCEPRHGCYLLPRGTGESRTDGASAGPSLTVTFADGHFSKLLFAGGKEAISQVTHAVMVTGNGSVAVRDVKALSIRPGTSARTSTVVRIDFKSNVPRSLATSIAAAIHATPASVVLNANHTTDGSNMTMVSTSASADWAESEDGESSSGSSLVAIVIVAIAVTVMAAVVRRKVQAPKAARKMRSGKVSPASMDGMILTSKRLDQVKAATIRRRSLTIENENAAIVAELTGLDNGPNAAVGTAESQFLLPGSPAPARSARRSTHVITLGDTPVSSPKLTRSALKPVAATAPASTRSGTRSSTQSN